MADTDLPWIFTVPLEREGVSYMLVGAFATIAFGAFRSTNDVDLVVSLDVRDARKLDLAFPESEFYRPPKEVILEELHRKSGGHLNFIHLPTGLKVDCYPTGGDDLQKWGIANRRKVEFENRSVWIAPPELVILKKLEYFREGGSEKHLRDIRDVVRLVDLDLAFLEQNINRLGLQPQWSQCIA